MNQFLPQKAQKAQMMKKGALPELDKTVWLKFQCSQQLTCLAVVRVRSYGALGFAFCAQLQAEVSIQLRQHHSIFGVLWIEFYRRVQLCLRGAPCRLIHREHLTIIRAVSWLVRDSPRRRRE